VTSNIFIDTVNLVARAATSGTALPNVRGKLYAELVLNVRFFDGTGTIIPVDVASVLMEIKLVDAPDGSPALLQSSSPVVAGSGNTTLYSFAWDYADSDNLRAALAGATTPAAMICAIQYALAGSTEQIDVPMSFENSYVRPEDQASDPVDAERWQWLTAHATDAGGFAHDDTTRLLSVPGLATNAAAIAAEVTAREEAIASEATAREEAIASEATARGTAISTAVAAEATARDAAISTAVASEAAARGTAISTAVASEATARNAAIATAVAAAGSPLQRGIGTLQGCITPPNPTAPPPLYCTYDGITDGAELYLSGYEWTAQVVISDSDPGDVVWVPYGTDLDTMGFDIVAALTALNLTDTLTWYYLGAGTFSGFDTATGSLVEVSATSIGGWSVTGGGSGSDGAAFGQVTQVTLIPGVSGKQTKMVAVGGFTTASPASDPSNVTVSIGLWDGESFYPCADAVPFSGSGADVMGAGPYYDKWTASPAPQGLDLVAQLGAGTIPTGGEHVLWAIADQS